MKSKRRQIGCTRTTRGQFKRRSRRANSGAPTGESGYAHLGIAVPGGVM